MAKKVAPDPTDTPDTVALRCEHLGETRELTSKHAETLLAYQQDNGLSGDASWQPVSAAPAE